MLIHGFHLSMCRASQTYVTNDQNVNFCVLFKSTMAMCVCRIAAPSSWRQPTEATR